jgi:mono/diheme cytochrome c family protein
MVAPMVVKNCVGCHRGAHPKHGLDLTSYAMVIKGDKEGKVVIAGKPADSRLSKAIHRKGATPMPPPKPLAPGDVAKIDAWIKAGAKP